MRLSLIRLLPRVQTHHQIHDDTHAAIACDMLNPGTVSGACFDGAHSPWPRPFAPPTPQQIALPCSPASQLLWPRPTVVASSCRLVGIIASSVYGQLASIIPAPRGSRPR